MLSSATDSGSCHSISSQTDSWIFRSRCSTAASAATSTVPPSIAVIREPATLTTPKPVLAMPGSMPITIRMVEDSRPVVGCLPEWAGRARKLRQRPLHHFFADVEVRVDGIDVVVLLERLDQVQQGLRLALLDRHRVLRVHRDVGGDDLDAGLVERSANRGELARRGEDAERPIVVDHVL